MDAAFDELLTQTVVISTGKPTMDLNGVETYAGSGSTYACRYVPDRETHRDRNGRTWEQVGVVWVDSTGLLSTSDIGSVDLGGGFFDVTPPVFAVEAFPDENGAYHHWKLRLGWQA